MRAAISNWGEAEEGGVERERERDSSNLGPIIFSRGMPCLDWVAPGP